jgi:CHAT domain-containing protein/Tfp pilus assembly protein PilF
MTTVRRVFLVWCLAGWFIFLHLPVAHAQKFDLEKVLKDFPEIHQAIEQKIIDRQRLKNVITLDKQGRYAEAIRLVEEDLKKAEKVLGPHHIFTATTKYDLATLYMKVGNYAQAETLQKQALDVRQKLLGPYHPHTIASMEILAKIYHARGSFDKALPLFKQVLEINEKVLGPEHADTGHSLNNLAECYRVLGEYNNALPLYQRSLKIAENIFGTNHIYVAFIINNIALLYIDMDLQDHALPLFKRSLKITENITARENPEVAAILNNLALHYYEIGCYDQALILYLRSLQIREKAFGVEHYKTAINLSYLATLYYQMGNPDKALPLYVRSLKIMEKFLGHEHPETARCYRNMAALYLDQKDYDSARNLLRRGKSMPGLVEVDIAQGRYEEALNHLKGLEPTWRSATRYHIQYFTQMGLCQAELGRRKEAAEALGRAVKEIEQLRQRIREPVAGFFQAGSFGGYLRAYRGLVAVLAEMAIRDDPLPSELQGYGQDPVAAAFAVAEATKGRVLLESLANAARRQTQVDIPPELRRREEKLLHQMASLEAQWEKAVVGGEEALKEAKARQERLTGDLQALVRELRKHHPLYAALYYPQPLPARDLPLGSREVLLEYALGDQSCYVFVVRRGGVQKLISIPLGREELTTKVKTFMGPFINRQVNGFSSQQGKELHDLLLAGALAEVKEGETVIIVPDGILGLLPFEALVVQEGPGLRDHIYVGDRHTFTYYQSATIMALQRRLQKERAHRPLFALGNPVFSSMDPRYAAAHGSKSAAGPILAKAKEDYAFRGLASRQEWGQISKGDQAGKALSFPPLPQTEQEVRAIAQTLGVKPEPPDVLLNLEANEARLRQSTLGEYRYLHFATHADLPGKMQGVNEAFILLGQVDNAEGDDGLLTMSKVLGLKLNAEMVVLSACLTGRGQVMEGEGVANFARAFQQAGARSVVVSLWEVASKEVVEYMTIFYGHLKEGKSRSQALQLARKEIKAKYPQPFYWAVFILHGEG